ncbi:hypothetical protein EPD60_12400 [Flaviaesturariibacter flavus]|uniref:Uncharacterized protein n=1 Tax=Flaviaesturariibacter flavus TaxID=2502780 RepID=A0A4V6NAY5_9BACT|nr:hypothetical protein [Flaviaesturariibacter flavus]TCJ13592.1 hypothetical protein EPD60_12400 [Flaviaesturariibacter flavus]
MTQEMYINIWQKYLPVIRIVMKRALAGDQVLKLNVQDFERLGLTRKAGYKFSLGVSNGKLTNVIVDFPFAAALGQVLVEDETVRTISANCAYTLSLSPRFELSVSRVALNEDAPVSDSNA